jgi:hypothetical protein
LEELRIIQAQKTLETAWTWHYYVPTLHELGPAVSQHDHQAPSPLNSLSPQY